MKPSSYTVRYSRNEIDHYYRTGLWSTDTFHDLLVRRVEETPDKVFATDGTRSLTFKELFKAGQRLAVGLHRQGLRRGDTAAVQLPNWVEFIQVLTALSRLGVIMVPIMPIYRHEDVAYVMSNAGVRAVFTPEQFGKFDYLGMYLTLREDDSDLRIVVARPDTTGGQAARAHPNVFTLSQLEADTDDDSARAELGDPPGADDPFVIVYTSGTTSRSKGCVHTFNTYCSGSRSLIEPFGYTANDVQFGPSPIAHTTGLVTSVLLPLLAGASTHVMAKWDPARAIDEIQRFGCTAAVTAPTFLHTLLSEYDAQRHDLSTLRMWTCAGAPIPAAVVERSSAKLPNVKVLSLYGRSENLVTTTCSVTDDVSRALTSDGRALPGAEVRIVGPDGDEVSRGIEGDIAYRGPAHMIEYLASPEETTALFTSSGFSRSGDLGTMTEDGYVRVTGRTKDIVIRGGMNISVREIEDHLAHHPSLHAAAVVGMPDERLGEKVCCFLVAAVGHDAPTVDEIREFLLERGMPIQKTPERVEVVDSLPMTATGKVLKHELRREIERRLRAQAAPAHQTAGAS
ncbi:fatty-acid--CoA ligase [Mycobacterium gordonae]|uniref:Fatty-acid--CoA ligase n=1 Tax=Mycobacterium gordonae TaxID=1778 RepID=A0A0Q2QMG5_MYCGO|nr:MULTISPECIES: AMP-binding protein [Mycobacterium]KQH81013.1 fatty-acid--CoA ligase [Mycobacterium gordonae]MDP7731235.1 AMP-binding protein [Mycobacterium sp. TY813]